MDRKKLTFEVKTQRIEDYSVNVADLGDGAFMYDNRVFHDIEELHAYISNRLESGLGVTGLQFEKDISVSYRVYPRRVVLGDELILLPSKTRLNFKRLKGETQFEEDESK